jgi:uncharacterized protein (TIGR01777 family)
MHVLLTGGTGTIGRRLVGYLIEQGHRVTVVSRQPYRPASIPAKIGFAQWDGQSAAGWGHLLEEVVAVVNLAGAGLADSRWTEERKQEIVDSRVNAGKAVAEAFEEAENKPGVLIQASAVAIYGNNADESLTESSRAASDFLADVCQKWEDSTAGVTEMGVRRVVIRTGVVLDTLGGALPRMIMPYRFFVVGRVGAGNQWISWIHYHDVVDSILFLMMQESAAGPVNLTAPEPVQNRTLAKAIGGAMRRPSALPAPGFAMKAAFGEMSTVLLDGQKVLPERLVEAGYEFAFPTVVGAVDNLLGNHR